MVERSVVSPSSRPVGDGRRRCPTAGLGAALAMSVLIAVSGCVGADASRASADLEVQEAIFTHQLEKHCRGGRSGFGACFLQLPDKTDPAPELLARFSGHDPVVKPVSAARVSAKDSVTDPESGKPGKVLVIGWVRWLGENVVTATGTEYASPSSGSMHTYEVEHRGDRWVVVSDERHGR